MWHKLYNSITRYQLYFTTISNNLRVFFNKNSDYFILFWNWSSSIKWFLHLLVDKESKHLKVNPIFPSKSLQKFSRKKERNFIVHKWQVYFQALEYKGRNFLNLNDNNYQPICLTYTKVWIKHFGFSNLMCAYITRLITNHAPIGKYSLRFSPKESFTYLCENYLFKMRRHILFEYVQYNKF